MWQFHRDTPDVALQGCRAENGFCAGPLTPVLFPGTGTLRMMGRAAKSDALAA
jgi:hypothetical protein